MEKRVFLKGRPVPFLSQKGVLQRDPYPLQGLRHHTGTERKERGVAHERRERQTGETKNHELAFLLEEPPGPQELPEL